MRDLDYFAVRPDRFDERDYTFRPGLDSAPAEFIPPWVSQIEVLRQTDASCTGHAAAALVQALQLRLTYNSPSSKKDKIATVSQNMLYQLGRIYDEWEGESYSGSSCRGVLKGWHHHGVCDFSAWDPTSAVPTWQKNAKSFPIGAYYRVDHRSITDMQLAVHEAGAVLVTARLHTGWLSRFGDATRTAIDTTHTSIGLHAFLVTGYCSEGLIVHNSWGLPWGADGAAILRYEDWLTNAVDAWVVSLGAPVNSINSPRFRTEDGLLESSRTAHFGSNEPNRWQEEKCRFHTVSFGKNGEIALRRVDAINVDDEVEKRLGKTRRNGKLRIKKNLMVFFPAGFDSEESYLQLISWAGPLLERSNITPLFVVWRTGFLRELVSGFEAHQIVNRESLESLRWRPEARDSFIELQARRHLRPYWTEVKQDARLGAKRALSRRHSSGAEGGLRTLSKALERVKDATEGLSIHLVAHSAGALPLLELLSCSTDTPVVFSTCTLLAPLCSAETAISKLAPAFEKKQLDIGSVNCAILPRSEEQRDGVGPFYSPSLPVLISRSLESDTDVPILGLETIWNPPPQGDTWHPDHRDAARQWRRLRAQQDIHCTTYFPDPAATDSQSPISPRHIAFGYEPDVFHALAKYCSKPERGLRL